MDTKFQLIFAIYPQPSKLKMLICSPNKIFNVIKRSVNISTLFIFFEIILAFSASLLKNFNKPENFMNCPVQYYYFFPFQFTLKSRMKKFEYKGKQWHEECFCCMICKEPIKNKSFIPRDDQVVCVPCYEEQFAQKCTKCNGVINKGGVAYKNSPWHKECFLCTNCNKELAKEKFTSRDDKPYCADCYGELFAKKCCKCSKAITGSMVGKGFLMHEGNIVCPQCGRSMIKTKTILFGRGLKTSSKEVTTCC
ncbi:hypothetical protein KUTeg_007159 [Tegillarca granosa]|uniref:LIM zinc-binding domain-containing protein n=1 Tax=Tegillarca granosa TaxID=220873 RepID=A0ABQ9FCF1_TEGGR|nr:hypothetical protein KUTeg_007159 [Tegillarca granosa]